MTIIICDIDGVLANCERRLQYLNIKDYSAFYGARMADDTMIESGKGLLYALKETIYRHSIYYATGRPESTRNLTLNWLDAHCMPQAWPERLFMRKDGVYRSSPEVKVEQVKQILESEGVIAGEGVIGELKNIATKVASVFNGEAEKPPTVYFIDDDPKNVKAVCDEFPFIAGITFGVKRMEEK